MKVRQWFRVHYQRIFGVEVVNCSTCPYWAFHSTREAMPRSRVVQDGATFRIERDHGAQAPLDRIGVCLKAPLVFVPMVNMGMGVRATMAADVCAKHPKFVPVKVAGSSVEFRPGVGEHAGFDRPLSFEDALKFAQLRPDTLPSPEEIEGARRQRGNNAENKD